MSTLSDKAGASGIAADWAGELELTPIAEVIRRIVLEERSGDLRVTSPQAVKTIHFDRGFAVFASSNLKSESLGERLIASGRISPHEFALVSMLTKSSKRSFRQTLAHAGIVPEEELGRHVAAQVNEIVLSLFSVKEGTYNFEEGPCAIPLELMVSLSAHRILLEGIRRMGSGKLILSGLPPLDSLIRVVEAPHFSLDFGKIAPVERTVLRLAGTRVSIRRILATAGEDKGKVLRACYGLYGAGVLELAMSDAPRAPRRVQEETGTFVVSEILRKIGPRREIDAEEAVDVSREWQEPERSPVADKAPTFLEDGGAPPLVETAAVTREEPVAPYVAQTPASSRVDEENAQGVWARAISFIVAMVEALWSVVSTACRGTGLLWNELRANARKAGSASEGPEPYSSTEASTTRIETREPPAGRAATPYSARRELQTVEEPSRKESVGIPSWSTLDASNDTHVASSASYEPVWPEPEEQEPVLNRLGVPKWSSRDDPDEAPTPPVGMFEETSQEQESASEKLPPPSWSILDDPRRAVPKEKKESPAPAEPSEELVLHL